MTKKIDLYLKSGAKITLRVTKFDWASENNVITRLNWKWLKRNTSLIYVSTADIVAIVEHPKWWRRLWP